MPFYAVKIGKTPGIYNTWNECNENIKGLDKVVYKKFDTESEAKNYMDNIQINLVDKSIDLSTCINIYIDGSCINSGTVKAIGGIGIYFGESDIRNIHHKIVYEQPNKMNIYRIELKAILTSLLKVLEEVVENKLIVIHTDSEYAISALTTYSVFSKAEKNVPNADYINRGIYILYKYPNIKLRFTKGILNSRCDHSKGILEANRLANIALRKDLPKILFGFGKYKDRSFGEIYSIDSDYFDWCLLNCKTQINDIKLFLESKNDD